MKIWIVRIGSKIIGTFSNVALAATVARKYVKNNYVMKYRWGALDLSEIELYYSNYDLPIANRSWEDFIITFERTTLNFS